ncbi:MAG: iron-sulfur cluster assembly scaffold protein [Chloroflexi bacterium]|nr:iron-sulfur cluster assembly scaffold protein [Chloroflexota bacterium]
MRTSGIVIEHYENPRNQGAMPGADVVAEATNPQCGDTMRLYLKVKGSVITKVRWETRGCGTSIAASSMASEMIEGMKADEASRVTSARIAQALGGLPPAKAHCAVLAADAIHEAVRALEAKKAASS